MFNKLNVMRLNIVGFFEKAYSYLPNLSSELKNFIAAILPSLSIIFGLLITLSSVLELLGTPLISIFSVKSSGLPAIQILLLTNVIGVAQGLLMIFAYGPLKKRQEKGWKFLIWSQILWILSAILSFSDSFIIAFILLYPIIQTKSEYK